MNGRCELPWPTTRLAILNAVPDGFLECGARDLHRLLDGPTLIELPGKRGPPLFVSVLQHGNEDTGLVTVQRVIISYQQGLLPRPLMLLVGNVRAARHGLRRLDDQPDYNRIWPGAHDLGDVPEARIMAEVHARVLDRGAVAAIDLHNNSGQNPQYAVVCNLKPRTLGLAALFSRRLVYFRGIPGAQTASFSDAIPAITAECGSPGEPANADAASRLIESVLTLDDLPRSDGARLDLFHTLGVVRVQQDVSFSFGGDQAELQLDPSIDKHNFRDLHPGTVLGKTSHAMPLQMIDEAGIDVAQQYFKPVGGELALCRPGVPAMLTRDPRIVRQDCLCYLMERL